MNTDKSKKTVLAYIMTGSLLLSSTVHAQTLVIGADAKSPPFEFVNPKTNEVVGYSVDYIKAAAKAMGITTEVVHVPWNNIFNSLEKGEIDVIASSVSVTITPVRKQTIAVTDPYFENGQTLIVRENSRINSFDDLSEKVVAGQHGTTAVYFLPRLNKDAIPEEYETLGIALELLRQGEVDAVVCDELAAYYYTEQDPAYANRLKVADKDKGYEQFGFLVHKQKSELLSQLNKGIEKIKQNGTAKEIYDEWLRQN